MRSWVFRIIVTIGLIVVAAVLVVHESHAHPLTQSGQITGQVRYTEGGQPAFNILVRCDSFNSGSCGQEMTDRSGRFRFTGLSPAKLSAVCPVTTPRAGCRPTLSNYNASLSRRDRDAVTT